MKPWEKPTPIRYQSVIGHLIQFPEGTAEAAFESLSYFASHAFMSGTTLGQSPLHGAGLREVARGRGILEACMRILDESFCEEHSPLAEIYKAVFWYAAGLAAEGLRTKQNPHGHWQDFGAQSQRTLVRALAKLSVKDRHQVHDLNQAWKGDKATWRMHFVGAMSVARVAMALHSLGLHPILSTLEVDACHKVDLMARIGENEAKLVCLQVKTKGKRDFPYVEALQLPWTPPMGKDDHSKVVRGMCTLRERECLSLSDVVGAIVYVGKQDELPWEYEDAFPLAKALADVLRKAI